MDPTFFDTYAWFWPASLKSCEVNFSYITQCYQDAFVLATLWIEIFRQWKDTEKKLILILLLQNPQKHFKDENHLFLCQGVLQHVFTPLKVSSTKTSTYLHQKSFQILTSWWSLYYRSQFLSVSESALQPPSRRLRYVFFDLWPTLCLHIVRLGDAGCCCFVGTCVEIKTSLRRIAGDESFILKLPPVNVFKLISHYCLAYRRPQRHKQRCGQTLKSN